MNYINFHFSGLKAKMWAVNSVSSCFSDKYQELAEFTNVKIIPNLICIPQTPAVSLRIKSTIFDPNNLSAA